MVGVTSVTLLSDTAYLWIVTTKVVEEHPFVFARYSQMFIRSLLQQQYTSIQGCVDPQFTKSVRWLKWLGFEIRQIPDTPKYCRFEMRRAGLMGIALGILGAVTSFAGTIMGAMGQSGMASYQAQVARNNAIIAEQNAVYAIQVGETKGQQQGFKTGALLGRQKAVQAASGVDVGTGSALEARKSSAELGRLDQLTIINEAQGRASQFRAQKMQFEAEAGLKDLQASYLKTAGILGGAGTLIGGIGGISDKWMSYKRSGADPWSL